MQCPASTTAATAVATVFRLLAAVFVVATGLVRPGGVLAAEPAAAAADRHPELKRLSPAEEVWIDPATRRVVVGGRVALDKGVIEYFACPADTGKEHESVVTVGSTARLVHAALLAIGLEPGHPASFDPEYVAARGPIVDVTMGWKDPSGGWREMPAQEWIRDTRTGKPMQERWVFAGSTFWKDPTDGKEYYQADGGDMICVSNTATAMLDVPIESSQSNEELLFEIFEGRVPPRGTPVEIVLTAAPRPAARRSPAEQPAPEPPADGQKAAEPASP